MTTISKEALELTGTRVFNRGDMANLEHWCIVRAIMPATKYGSEQVMLMEESDPCHVYWIPTSAISNVDNGTGRTRFVTEAAFKALRKAQQESRLARA